MMAERVGFEPVVPPRFMVDQIGGLTPWCSARQLSDVKEAERVLVLWQIRAFSSHSPDEEAILSAAAPI